MKDVAFNPAVSLATPAKPGTRTSEGSRDEHAQAWQREMERLQMEAWLAHSVVGYTPLATVPTPAAPPAGLATASLVASGLAVSLPPPMATALTVESSVPAPAGEPTAYEAPRQNLTQESRDTAHGHSIEPRKAQQPEGEAQVTREDQPQAEHARPDSGRVPVGAGPGARVEARSPRATPGQPPAAPAASAETSTSEAAADKGRRIEARDDGGANPHATPSTAGARQDTPSRDPQIPFDSQELARSLQSFGRVELTATSASPRAQPGASWPSSVAINANGQTSLELQPPQADIHSGPVPSPASADAEPQTGALQADQAREYRAARSAHASPAKPVSRTAGEAPADIRVHAEWSSQGVRLWLGVDAQALNDVGPMASHLQHWMATQGVRLLSMTCNGRLLVDRESEQGRSFEAFTAASDQSQSQPGLGGRALGAANSSYLKP